MNFFKSFFAMAILAFLVSCDAQDEISPSGDIVGSWEAIEFDYEGTSTSEYMGIETSAPFTGTAVELDLTVVFKEDPQAYVSEGGYVIRLTTTSNGQSYDQDIPIQGFLNEGTWSKEGDKLSITTPDGEVQTATITELTGTSLKLTYSEKTITEQQGLTTTMEISGGYSFIKK